MPEQTTVSGPPTPLDSPALVQYRRSQTFLARLPDPAVYKLRLFTTFGVLALFFLVIPGLNLAGKVPDYKVQILGKYLSFAVVALGIDLIWGYTGLLSLCQALFFCLGGYAMAMHLSLPQGGGDVRPEYNDIPQFMFFNNLHELPAFWRPFGSLPFTLLAGVALPAIVAGVFGFFIFRSRVRGVYFSIVTQAVAWGTWLLISRNEMLLGGTNGLTNFSKALTEKRSWILGLYLTTATLVVVTYLVCRAITNSRLGRVLVAVRDKETRLYFAGYRPYAFKVFAFAVAAGVAGVGGMLYAPQQAIITPQNMNVEASILMVIWVAVGGRGKLWGGIFGALLVNYTYAAITSDIGGNWLLFEGAMFIAVVLGFPDGFVGVWATLEKQLKQREMRGFWITASAFLAVTLFIIAEALDAEPRFLQAAQIASVPLKYYVLLGILAACVGLGRANARRLRVATPPTAGRLAA